MKLVTRFFEVSGQYKLTAFEAQEDAEVALPDGSVLVHAEPVVADGAITGFDLWVLVPSDSMAEAVNLIAEGDLDDEPIGL